MSYKDGASKALKQSAATAAGIEIKEYENLTTEEKEKLEVIRQSIALDILGYTNAKVERVLGLKRNALAGLRGNHPGLWELAHSDVLRRTRELVGAVNESIAEMISYGQWRALGRLEHIFRGGKRTYKFHGHPAFQYSKVNGEVSAAVMVNACNAYMKGIEVLRESIINELGKEEAEKRGLETANDDYANKYKEDKIAKSKEKLVKKFKESRAEDSARSYADATEAKSDKDRLPIQ